MLTTDYPDLMPAAEDIDDPQALIARLQARARGEEPARDAFDEALDELLAQAAQDPADAAGPGATDTPAAPEDRGTPEDPGSPEDPRPV